MPVTFGAKMSSHPMYNCGMNSGGVLPPSTLSALQFLRRYNHMMLPQESDLRYDQLASTLARYPYTLPSADSIDRPHSPPNTSQVPLIANSHNLFYPHLAVPFGCESAKLPGTRSSSPCNSLITSVSSRRKRGEKKPIPDEQKDEKYFERRRRNNEAAKKSRDARKIREDQIALRASMLEHENAILRAQVFNLREEATSLRQMLLIRKHTLEVMQMNV